MQTEDAAAVAKAAGLSYLDPATLRFTRAGATLRLTIENQVTHLSVSVLRAFPLSEPGRYLSVRGEKDEIGLVVDPQALDPESRALVNEELHRRYVTPEIRRVTSVRERFETVEWTVDTDRGPCQFTTRNLRESMVHPSPNRYILTDVDANRYDIPDLTALPVASRLHLVKYL